jgi:hypothetical protein
LELASELPHVQWYSGPDPSNIHEHLSRDAYASNDPSLAAVVTRFLCCFNGLIYSLMLAVGLEWMSLHAIQADSQAAEVPCTLPLFHDDVLHAD